MSNAVFPTLAGLTWNVLKSPRWSTKVQSAVGGKEMRAQFFSTPLYTWTLTYELLRASALLELQTLLGFFNARQGRFDSFLFSDPSDNNVTQMGFGVGDGVKTAFQLQRTLAGPRQADFSGVFPVSTVPRTNLAFGSATIGAANWAPSFGGTGVAPIVTASAFPDPQGGLAASRLRLSQGSGVTSGDFSMMTGSSPAGIPGVTYTASLWLRSNTGANQNAYFALAGVGALLITITPAWQRFSLTVPNWPNASQTAIYIGLAGTVTPANSLLDILAFGAQAELGTVATGYIGTTGATATVNPSYYPLQADGFEPVFDWSGTPAIFRQDWQGNQPLFPMPRINGILFSEQADNAAWNKSGLTVVANSTGDPSGANTADSLVRDGTAQTDPFFQYALTLVAGATKTFSTSIWLRAAAPVSASLVLYASGIGSFPTAITITTTWQRFTFSRSILNSGGITCNIGMGLFLPASSTVFAFGAQLEDSVAPTAYIPTTATAVTVTDYTLSATGLVTFISAPLAAAALTWTGSYYWRVRFDLDQADFNNFLSQLWEAKKITLVSVKT